MTKTQDAPTFKLANKRGAARLGVVQALYQMDVAQTALRQAIEEYVQFRLGQEVDGDTYLPADIGYFENVLRGVVDQQRVIDPYIHQALPADWPLKRIDILLRAILRAGAYELLKRKDVPIKVIISEYVDIAKAYYKDGEPKLVNAVLDHLAREVREDEFTSKA